MRLDPCSRPHCYENAPKGERSEGVCIAEAVVGSKKAAAVSLILFDCWKYLYYLQSRARIAKEIKKSPFPVR
jgi:hypothetical protein